MCTLPYCACPHTCVPGGTSRAECRGSRRMRSCWFVAVGSRRHRRCGSQPRHSAGRGWLVAHHDHAHAGPLRFLAGEVAADSAYGSAENLAWLVHERGIEPHTLRLPPQPASQAVAPGQIRPVFDKSQRSDGTFSRSDLAYDHRRDLYTCPGSSSSNTAVPSVSPATVSIPRASCVTVRASSIAVLAR